LQVAAIAFLTCALFSVLSSPAQALEETSTGSTTPEFKVKPLFEGRYRDGNWATFDIKLRNGSQPWRGEVRATLPYGPDSGYTFSHPVDLAAGAEDEFFFYVLPTRFEPRVEVVLVDNKEQEVSSVDMRLALIGTTDYTVGVLADPEKLNLNSLSRPGVIRIKQSDTRLVLVPLPLNEVPDRADALDAFDSIVVGNLEPGQLTPEQWRLLTGWVEEGGKLILSGGPNFPNLAKALDPLLVAARPEGTLEVGTLVGRNLPDTVLPAILPREKPVITLQRLTPQPDTQVAMTQEDSDSNPLPLIVGRSLGKGAVLATAFDLMSPSFSNINDTTLYWSAVMDAANPGPENVFLKQDVFEMNALPRLISDQPPSELPNPLWFLLGLGLYTLVIAPGCYLLYRKFDRPLLSLVLAPALALVCGGLVWQLGQGLAAGQVHLNQVTIASFYANNAPVGAKRMTVSVGAGMEYYTVELDGQGSPHNSWLYRPQNLVLSNPEARSAPPQLFVQSPSSATSQVQSAYNRNHFQAFSGEGTLDSHFTVEAKLAVLADGTGIGGTITNTSGWNVSDAALVLGDNYLYLGNLPNGEPQKINFTFTKRPNLFPRQSVELGLYGSSVVTATVRAGIGSVDSSVVPVSNDTQDGWRRNLLWTTLNTAYLNGRFAAQYQNYDLYLTGWLQGQQATELTGPLKLLEGLTTREQNFAMLIKPLSFSYQPNGDSKVVVPASTLTATRVLTTDTSSASDGSIKLSAGGSMIMQYRLPSLGNVRPSRLSLLVNARRDQRNGPQAGPQLEIYNWKAQNWELVASQGDPRPQIDLTGPAVASYVEPVGGFVRIRTSTKGEVYILQQLNIELEAIKL
jgi:hypothetical protein